MPGTTPKFGWTYPDPTDKIAQGADTVGQFVQNLENQMVLDPSSKAMDDPPSSYPLGMSMMGLSTDGAVSGGWPENRSAQVVTFKRTPWGDQVVQYWYRFTSGMRAMCRGGNAGADTWGSWYGVTGPGTPDHQASGQITLSTQQGNGSGLRSGYVKFPPGRFNTGGGANQIRVVCSLNQTTRPDVGGPPSAVDVTADGFTLYVERHDEIGQSVNWLATQGVD